MKTEVIKVDAENPSLKDIQRAAVIIRQGGLVAFPTETVYGIAANLESDKAVKALYEVKQRPRNKPFTVHIASVDMIKKMGCSITAAGKSLIDRFWPGPLTVILRSGGGEKIGFRMPANKVALELIASSGVPVAAPSANISGEAPPTNAGAVLRSFDGRVDAVLDGGPTTVALESTVVDLTVSPPVVVREGAIKKADIFDGLVDPV